ncbi:helix-turn-helix domain-containing protein [Longispora sp. NPDC051575]|uniref:helix-turn-helix domain-containing protein n=1 Tax=Longispora sp. NPDC051575 TaxID=3154943 RepID=UPI0034350A3D
MSVIRFEVADVADVRFGISPLWETVRSLYALADPGRHAVHLPWVREVRHRATAGLPFLRDVAAPGAWLPDFLTPPPAGPLVEFSDELALLRATPPDVVTADLTATTVRRPLAPRVRAGLEDPEQLLGVLADAVSAWHEAAILPYWPRMRSLLEGDIAHRSRQLAEGGPRRLFDTLHPTVRWAGDRLLADDPWDLDLDLRGRGLPLMPSVFVDRRVLWNIRSDSPPVAVYPARAAALLWEGAPAPDGLAGAIGASRARLLALVRSPATTTELARRVGLSPAAVSQHLHVLLAAGLVARTPHGRSVLYLVTHPGTVLLDATT